MSVSSTSSRGSASTGTQSSRGSLNSLIQHVEPVNDNHTNLYHLPSTTCPPIYEARVLASKAETTDGLNRTCYSPFNYRASHSSPASPYAHFNDIRSHNGNSVGVFSFLSKCISKYLTH